MYRRFAPILLTLSLAACATSSPTPQSPPPAASNDSVSDAPAPENRLLFHLLAAELAGTQGDVRQSLDAYLEAMRLSEDPRVAERAARLALYLHDRPAALEAASRWRQLAPQDPAPNEVLALSALRSGQLDESLGHLREVLLLEPAGIGPAFERVARLLVHEAGPSRERALAVMQALVADYPNEPQAQQALAELALQFEQPDLAIEAADRAKALDADWSAPDLLKVRAYLKKNHGEQAATLLSEVLRRRPDDYDLRLQYARTLLGLERTDSALQQFELLLKARPDDAHVRYVAALLALELGENDRARSYLLQLVNGGQRADDAYFYLGRLAQAEGDTKGALRWYRRVEGTHRADALLRVASLLAQQGQPAAAYAQLHELRRQYPKYAVQSYLTEASLLQREGRLEEALAVLDTALAEHPKDADLRYSRALNAVLLGRLEEAERELRELLAENPDSAAVLNALGYTLVDQTARHEEGFELIQHAYALTPDDPAIIDSMGWALFRLNRVAEAREMLERAYELHPDGEIAAHLAEVLWQQGERRAAKRVLAEALKREPTHKVLLETRKRLQ
jgi:tetratricopeptide (TPR) repeat protein